MVSTGSGAGCAASRPRPPIRGAIWGVSATLLRLASPHLQVTRRRLRSRAGAISRSKRPSAGTNIQVVVIGQNTKAIDKASGPKAWEHLFEFRKWKGKLAFTDPPNSAFSYAAATALLSLWGADDAAWTKMGMSRGLRMRRCSTAPTQVLPRDRQRRISAWHHARDAGSLWAHNGAPASIAHPAEGTYAGVGVATGKGGPTSLPNGWSTIWPARKSRRCC